MKRTIATTIFIITVILGVNSQNYDIDPSFSEDKKAILQAIQNGMLGWEQKDVVLATKDYAEITDWTNAFGDRFQTKEELAEFFRFLFKLPTVMAGKSKYMGHDMKFIGENVAVVRSKSVRIGQKKDDGSDHGDRHITHLRVFEKKDGKWLIVSHLIAQQLDASKR